MEEEIEILDVLKGEIKFTILFRKRKENGYKPFSKTHKEIIQKVKDKLLAIETAEATDSHSLEGNAHLRAQFKNLQEKILYTKALCMEKGEGKAASQAIQDYDESIKEKYPIEEAKQLISPTEDLHKKITIAEETKQVREDEIFELKELKIELEKNLKTTSANESDMEHNEPNVEHNESVMKAPEVIEQIDHMHKTFKKQKLDGADQSQLQESLKSMVDTYFREYANPDKEYFLNRIQHQIDSAELNDQLDAMFDKESMDIALKQIAELTVHDYEQSIIGNVTSQIFSPTTNKVTQQRYYSEDFKKAMAEQMVKQMVEINYIGVQKLKDEMTEIVTKEESTSRYQSIDSCLKCIQSIITDPLWVEQQASQLADSIGKQSRQNIDEKKIETQIKEKARGLYLDLVKNSTY